MTGQGITEQAFGRLSGGDAARLFELRLANGVSARLTDLGAALVGLSCADRDGRMDDIVLACGDGAAQQAQRAYFGAVIGRVAGRISGARIDLADRTLHLAANHGPHQMHGGIVGLSGRRWRAHAVDGPDPSVRFETESPDGDEGFPGHLRVSATWVLAPPCRLSILIEASCDAPTPFNPTIHPYFNLDGHTSGTLAHHRLAIAASRYTPIGADCLPTGTIEDVAGTAFDFREARSVLGDGQPGIAGFDHNYVIDRAAGSDAPVARLHSVRSGRTLLLRTDRPCLHLYTGGSLNGIEGKEGTLYRRGAGMCLEPQAFPDMFRHAAFPGEWLEPGSKFTSRTVYEFSRLSSQD